MGILSLQLTRREEPHRIVPCTIVCIKQTFNKINNLIDWLIDWEVLLLLDNVTWGPAQWCYEYPLVANTHLLKVFNSALKTNKNLPLWSHVFYLLSKFVRYWYSLRLDNIEMMDSFRQSWNQPTCMISGAVSNKHVLFSLTLTQKCK